MSKPPFPQEVEIVFRSSVYARFADVKILCFSESWNKSNAGSQQVAAYCRRDEQGSSEMGVSGSPFDTLFLAYRAEVGRR